MQNKPENNEFCLEIIQSCPGFFAPGFFACPGFFARCFCCRRFGVASRGELMAYFVGRRPQPAHDGARADTASRPLRAFELRFYAEGLLNPRRRWRL
ncbi:MAG: hypothetical protein WBD40_13460 [Tepidisphaeraceae bacterium]